MTSRFFTVTVPSARLQNAYPLSWAVKHPNTDRDYFLYLGPSLTTDGNSVTAVTVYGQEGITLGTPSIQGDKIAVHIGGGLDGTTYEIGFNLQLLNAHGEQDVLFVIALLPVGKQTRNGAVLIPAPVGPPFVPPTPPSPDLNLYLVDDYGTSIVDDYGRALVAP